MDFPIVRTLCFFFDNAIYSLIPLAYQLLIYLSNIDIFSNNPVIGDLMGRIYILLGIFMLFKVGFSILQYLIDPNSVNDKSRGMGKLITNTLVSIFLLVMVPWIFQVGFDLQSAIVKDNTIGKLIMGQSTSSSIQDTESIEEMGTDVQFLMYSAFFSVNKEAFPACEKTPVLGSQSMAATLNEGENGCLYQLNEGMKSNDDISGANVNLNDFFKYVGDDNKVHDERNFWSFNYLLWWKVDNNYVINYLPLISAAAGGYVALLLIVFCVDIAVRVVKLCFLQMVAPIAIISHIDPKEQFGQSKLKNWLSNCLTTYASLFIRLAAIFLAMKLIQAISLEIIGTVEKNPYETNEYMNTFIWVFLVIGLFVFVKQVPKMIESIFGIKSSGELQLNPFKAQGGGAIIGGGLGLAAVAPMAFRNIRDYGIRAGVATAVSGAEFGVKNHDKKDLAGQARNNAFQDITGNSMARYSLADTIMRPGNKNRTVRKVKDTMGPGYSQQRELEGRLAEATHLRAQAAQKMQEQGIDENRFRQIYGAESVNETQNIANAALLENLRQQNHNLVQQPRLAGVDYTARDNEIQANNARISELESISEYSNSVQTEMAIRSALSDINRNMGTLKDNKTELEKVHRIDSNKRKDRKEAMDKVSRNK